MNQIEKTRQEQQNFFFLPSTIPLSDGTRYMIIHMLQFFHNLIILRHNFHRYSLIGQIQFLLLNFFLASMSSNEKIAAFSSREWQRSFGQQYHEGQFLRQDKVQIIAQKLNTRDSSNLQEFSETIGVLSVQQRRNVEVKINSFSQ